MLNEEILAKNVHVQMKRNGEGGQKVHCITQEVILRVNLRYI